MPRVRGALMLKNNKEQYNQIMKEPSPEHVGMEVDKVAGEAADRIEAALRALDEALGEGVIGRDWNYDEIVRVLVEREKWLRGITDTSPKEEA